MRNLSRISAWFWIWLFRRFYGYSKIPTKTIFAQASLETGDFRSNIFRENRNIFGMKLAQKRETLGTGQNRDHATYRSVKDSVRDYFLRQKNFGIPNDLDRYQMATIKSGYAEDPQYLRKWESLERNLKVPHANLFALMGLFFLGVIIVFYTKSNSDDES